MADSGVRLNVKRTVRSDEIAFKMKPTAVAMKSILVFAIVDHLAIFCVIYTYAIKNVFHHLLVSVGMSLQFLLYRPIDPKCKN